LVLKVTPRNSRLLFLLSTPGEEVNVLYMAHMQVWILLCHIFCLLLIFVLTVILILNQLLIVQPINTDIIDMDAMEPDKLIFPCNRGTVDTQDFEEGWVESGTTNGATCVA
jgi:hypothetical protein